jgi:hypothetical protein
MGGMQTVQVSGPVEQLTHPISKHGTHLVGLRGAGGKDVLPDRHPGRHWLLELIMFKSTHKQDLESGSN